MDEGPFVAHLVAVVRSGEDGDALAVVLHLVPLLLALVTPVAYHTCCTNSEIEFVGHEHQTAHPFSLFT